uniref:Beta-defensin-like domain-containing protein n=1 Tax=Malurus cyaneus samueli TaxID=2593467 RepID=A0A8C5TLB7_9PASS
MVPARAGQGLSIRAHTNHGTSRTGTWHVRSPCLPAVLLQAEVGMQLGSQLQGGYCSYGECPPDAWSIGRCSEDTLCCRG